MEHLFDEMIEQIADKNIGKTKMPKYVVLYKTEDNHHWQIYNIYRDEEKARAKTCEIWHTKDDIYNAMYIEI